VVHQSIVCLHWTIHCGVSTSTGGIPRPLLLYVFGMVDSSLLDTCKLYIQLYNYTDYNSLPSSHTGFFFHRVMSVGTGFSVLEG
jgi:hypothetical protein